MSSMLVEDPGLSPVLLMSLFSPLIFTRVGDATRDNHFSGYWLSENFSGLIFIALSKSYRLDLTRKTR